MTKLGISTAAAAAFVVVALSVLVLVFVSVSVFVPAWDGVWGAAASPACVGTLHRAGAKVPDSISEHPNKKPANLFVLFKFAR